MSAAPAPLGLYLHFPYCLRLCPYCDFAVTIARDIPHERYARAILTEWNLKLGSVPERPFSSIYVGGGTPSLWRPEWIACILEELRAKRGLTPDAEVTLEANPEHVTEDSLREFRSAGVNRLSLGAQSFSTRTLRALGRAHDGKQVEVAFLAARAAGFDNVTLDLIYGVHGVVHGSVHGDSEVQRRAEVRADVERAMALRPEHLSAYALTLDVDTLAVQVALSRRLAKGEIRLPPDEEVVGMAEIVADACESAGLSQYEISNFARPGRRSRHNQLYWNGDDCIGLGAGAVGFRRVGQNEAIRDTNLRDANAYLAAVESGALPQAELERLSPAEWARERIMTGLRRVEGVDVRKVLTEAGESWGTRTQGLSQLESNGLIQQSEGRVTLTRKGRHLHSAISAALIP
jgi:oxygen-independent coproporphyrinogen-3 oxidase